MLPSNVVEGLFKMLHDKVKNDPIDDRDANDCILNCVDVCDVVHDKLDVANGSVINVDDGFTSTSGSDDHVTRTSSSESDVDKMMNEQRDDDILKICFDMASRGKGRYLVRDGLLYRCEKLFGRDVEMLVIPLTRRKSVLHLAHDTSHQAMRQTRDRIRASLLTWPTLSSDCRHYTSHCRECQMKARITCYG
jgi:Integrase zinc binding domain